MATGDDRTLENLIRSTEELVRNLEVLGVGADASTLPKAAMDQIDSQAAVPFESFVEPSVDAESIIEVSPDGMEARGWFHPASGNGAPLALDSVRATIESKGITFGVAWDAVKGCILTCNEQRTEVSDAVIARGKAPVPECPPFLVLSDRLVDSGKKEGPGGARVDFKELALFTLVRKGEVLASLQPKRDGAMGMSVLGKAVAFGREQTSFPRAGKNTELQNGAVVAKCDGRFQLDTDSFWVEEVLDIAGDVDLKVGNIDFPGDVVIRGEIRDGFTVKAGKSILCTGCIGAARVECKGDLVTQQGIVGKEKAVILVGGAAEAKFLEGCALDAGGTVRVRTSVLNSTVHTADRLEMGERGIIIGGIVKAQNGVSAEQIGAQRGTRTEIHCGVDFKVEQKLVWIRDRNIALATRLKEIESRMAASARHREVLKPLHSRIKAAIHQLNENARALVTGLDRNERADVSVKGFVYPGTYIEICHVSHFNTKPRRTVTFRLDKASGKIVEAGWEKPRTRR
jgi:uncharacterized protein (DUF342 family)